MTLAALALASFGDDGDPVDAAVADLLPMTSDSPYQQRLLDDGVVTFSEYESAATRTLQCIEDNGYQASRELTPDSKFQITVRHTTANATAADDQYTRCASEYLTDVERTYAAMLPLDPGSDEGELAECLVEAGMFAEPPETRAHLIVTLLKGGEAVERCRDRVESR